MQPPGDPTFIIDYTASLSCRVYAVTRRPGALQYSTEQLLTLDRQLQLEADLQRAWDRNPLVLLNSKGRDAEGPQLTLPN